MNLFIWSVFAVVGGYTIGTYMANIFPTPLSSQWGGAIGCSVVLATSLYYVHTQLDQEIDEWLTSK